MNQSELETNTWDRHKAEENSSRQVLIVVVLLLIGW